MTLSYSALPFAWLGYTGTGSPISPIGVINGEEPHSILLPCMAETNSFKYIPHTYARHTRADAAIQMLCDIGADIDLEDSVGNAPLH
jgi:hypothetical protein